MVVAVITSGPTILRLQIPESLAGQVHAGSRVTTASFGGGQSEGRVIKVYPSVTAGQVTVDVDMPGGRLTISWAGPGQSVLMTGPAVTVFSGEIDVPAL